MDEIERLTPGAANVGGLGERIGHEGHPVGAGERERAP